MHSVTHHARISCSPGAGSWQQRDRNDVFGSAKASLRNECLLGGRGSVQGISMPRHPSKVM